MDTNNSHEERYKGVCLLGAAFRQVSLVTQDFWQEDQTNLKYLWQDSWIMILNLLIEIKSYWHASPVHKQKAIFAHFQFSEWEGLISIKEWNLDSFMTVMLGTKQSLKADESR